LIVIHSFDNFKFQKGDIVFNYVDKFDDIGKNGYDSLDNSEAYQIKINDVIHINALDKYKNVSGFIYGLSSLLELQIKNGGINYGVITD
jgi:hypothetical protein